MEKVLYYLSYDLVRTKNYQVLYDELLKFGAKRVLESVWCFKYSRGNSKVLRDHFIQFIDNDDRLIVIQSADWGGWNLLYNPNDI